MVIEAAAYFLIAVGLVLMTGVLGFGLGWMMGRRAARARMHELYEAERRRRWS